MAFVSRAERKLDYGSTSAGEIGPGAYNVASNSKKNYSYAPFSSTTLRKFEPQTNPAPGPGAYDSTDKTIRRNASDQFGRTKITAQFASKVERFNWKSTDALPGPGQYALQTNWDKKIVEMRPEPSSVNWLRLPSAPSIPSTHQKLGYDETPTGELVMQKNPEMIHSGSKVDSVGPGHYNVQAGAISSKGTSWHRYKSKRDLGSAPSKTNLGPGSYYEPKEVVMPLYKYKPSSVFASGCKRDCYIPPSGKTKDETSGSSDEDEVPGPGHYNGATSVSAFNVKPVPERLQFFGSTSSRFKAEKADKASIAPGMYGELRKPLAAKKPGDSKAPFASTKTRFEAKFDTSPGPGAYRDETIVDSINKKVWGRQGVFGSSERRFAAEKSNNSPGPGYYPPDADKRIGSHNSAKRKPGSMFLSKVKRHVDPPNADTPAPGAYEVQPKPKPQPEDKPEPPFKSAPKRFKEPKSEPIGPGTYYPQEVSKPAFVSKGFIVREPRFKDKVIPEEQPGPTTYYEERDDWTKPSFNVLFTDYS
mmetsp:Transcript_5241/g.9623  ORF Transcript_5241/g.9623 Transcript_5241/m.9623 type:complete len:531 (+) Transcript_5241:30-1622(+)